jgi:peptidoglycan/LPS O-acetylase OafA/YrhL
MKRYFRLTIPLGACVLLSLTFFSYISDGPLWSLMVNKVLVNLCSKWWWTTILYVGNYVNPGQLCFGHAWYLMIDMQLYIISPLILYPIWKFRNKTKEIVIAIFLLASISIIYVFVMCLKFNFRVSMFDELADVKEALLYYTTHSRIDSWMMGILTGFILFRLEGQIINTSKKFLIIGWTLSALVIAVVILSPYPLLQKNYQEYSLIADASFDAFKRVAWCMAVGWIIIACQLNCGGFVKRFLTLSIWMPISKLSYCIYLVHILIQLVYMASIRSPMYFSDFRVIYKFFGDFAMAFIFAFLIAVTFEYPTLRIIKILIDRKGTSNN